mmetsp:Transcript_28918/g.68134  ORF Transcript_28918/g.68134 Transcript_28918/m.68134 type:complete len:272 (-) Transcript_28918:601-1416(-)
MGRCQHFVEVHQELAKVHLSCPGGIQEGEDLVCEAFRLVETAEKVPHLLFPDDTVLLQIQWAKSITRALIAHPNFVADIAHHLSEFLEELAVHGLLETEQRLLGWLVGSQPAPGWLLRSLLIQSRGLWELLLLRNPEGAIVWFTDKAIVQSLCKQRVAHLARANLCQAVVERFCLLTSQVETPEEGTILVLRYAVLPRCTETAVGLLRLHEPPGLVLDSRQQLSKFDLDRIQLLATLLLGLLLDRNLPPWPNSLVCSDQKRAHEAYEEVIV